MLHNSPVKPQVMVPSFLISGGVHAAFLVPSLPSWVQRLAAIKHQRFDQQSLQLVLVLTVAWCVVVGVWSALVANVLSQKDNRWGGIGGLRLIGIVVGLTLALDLVNGPCFATCPPIFLVVPILSYVAILNNSVPAPEQKPAKK